MATTFSQPFTIRVTITPAIASIGLSATDITTGPANAGAVVGAFNVVTNPPGGAITGPIVLSGPSASLFSVTNGGVLPCNLVVGAAAIPAGSYSVTASITQ